jgi:hypothetical protein
MEANGSTSFRFSAEDLGSIFGNPTPTEKNITDKDQKWRDAQKRRALESISMEEKLLTLAYVLSMLPASRDASDDRSAIDLMKKCVDQSNFYTSVSNISHLGILKLAIYNAMKVPNLPSLLSNNFSDIHDWATNLSTDPLFLSKSDLKRNRDGEQAVEEVEIIGKSKLTLYSPDWQVAAPARSVSSSSAASPAHFVPPAAPPSTGGPSWLLAFENVKGSIAHINHLLQTLRSRIDSTQQILKESLHVEGSSTSSTHLPSEVPQINWGTRCSVAKQLVTSGFVAIKLGVHTALPSLNVQASGSNKSDMKRALKVRDGNSVMTVAQSLNKLKGEIMELEKERKKLTNLLERAQTKKDKSKYKKQIEAANAQEAKLNVKILSCESILEKTSDSSDVDSDISDFDE